MDAFLNENPTLTYLVTSCYKTIQVTAPMTYHQFNWIRNNIPNNLNMSNENLIKFLDFMNIQLIKYSVNGVVTKNTLKQASREAFNNDPKPIADDDGIKGIVSVRLQTLLLLLSKKAIIEDDATNYIQFTTQASFNHETKAFEDDNEEMMNNFRKGLNKVNKFCGVCNTETKKMCVCKLIYYCCSDCQKQDFKSHKKLCKQSKLNK